MCTKRSIRPWGLLAVALAAAPASAQCTAPASWFPHAQTPQPPNALSNEDPCTFHQWSWQTFLRLTQMVEGDLRFIKEMHSQDNLFDMSKYGKTLPPFQDLQKAGGRLRLRPRDGKPSHVRGGDDVNQAGDHGILVDQQHHAVYYAIHVNQVYYDFIRGKGYNDPATLLMAPATESFPVGSLEIKSAWRIVDATEPKGQLYTMTAELQRLKTENGHVVVDPDHVDVKTVELIGLHVAGVVEGHPEFVWATFEAQGNAPLLAPGTAMSSPGAVSPTGARLYAAGTAARDCNRPNGGRVMLNDATQALDPITQVVREIAWGGGTDTAEIQSLNQSVQRQLGADPAAGYDLIGSLWVEKGTLIPGTVPGSPDQQRGSIRLANTTMETFRQSVGNCFSCHDTRKYSDQGIAFPANNLNLSHALRRSYVANSLVQAQQGRTPAVPRK